MKKTISLLLFVVMLLTLLPGFGAAQTAQALAADGGSVSVQKHLPEKLRCRQLARLCGDEVKIVEHA